MSKASSSPSCSSHLSWAGVIRLQLLPADSNNWERRLQLWETSPPEKTKFHDSGECTLLSFPPVKPTHLFSTIMRTLEERWIVYLLEAATIFSHLENKHRAMLYTARSLPSPQSNKVSSLAHSCAVCRILMCGTRFLCSRIQPLRLRLVQREERAGCRAKTRGDGELVVSAQPHQCLNTSPGYAEEARPPNSLPQSRPRNLAREHVTRTGGEGPFLARPKRLF